ncbi:ribosomal protein S4 [Edhazardia aedis USNM 41457]|uniref:Ribosomal protein S4 n=1 Tax=Edhazardia aedis (strain USNM 41457) TaxID=1003232 RepID=J9D9N0_EDHAE|nr:ribosomal protein S4 [Edhazardia aedis USNM 41457]|eukprot:EJW04476.1 ribosomal protein S4 [Edhazardia aedis USNM 41457]
MFMRKKKTREIFSLCKILKFSVLQQKKSQIILYKNLFFPSFFPSQCLLLFTVYAFIIFSPYKMVVKNFSKRSRVPRRPFDRDRLIDEMKLLGTYGLKNKRELWIVQRECDYIKNRARDLLINPDEKVQIINGRYLLNKLVKLGILEQVDLTNYHAIIENLNSVLNLTASDFLERRLQYRVFQMGLAKDVHSARCLIAQKQISVRGNVVNKPAFMVKAEDEAYIEVYVHSAKAGAKLGRKGKKNKGKKAGDEDEDDQ